MNASLLKSYKGTITHIILLKYLRQNGWIKRETIKEGVDVYSNDIFPNRQLIIPTNSSFDDYDNAIQIALDKLPEIEHRKSEDLLRDLYSLTLEEMQTMTRNDAIITLSGKAVWYAEIAASLFGSFLTHLQKITYSIAEIYSGKAKSRGDIDPYTKKTTRLNVLPEFLPGSFGFKVRLPEYGEEQTLINDANFEPNEVIPSAVLEGTCDLLSLTTPEEKLVEIVAFPRLNTHYKNLLKLQVSEDLDIITKYFNYPVSKKTTHLQAQERLDWLEDIQTKEIVVSINGELVGGSIETGRFELKTADIIYRGKSNETVKRKMKNISWGSNVTMEVKVITEVQEEIESESKPSYEALDVYRKGEKTPALYDNDIDNPQ